MQAYRKVLAHNLPEERLLKRRSLLEKFLLTQREGDLQKIQVGMSWLRNRVGMGKAQEFFADDGRWVRILYPGQ